MARSLLGPAETERLLREREAEFRTLANVIPQLAWIADAEGRRYWFNDRWYEYTGLRRDQCLGLGWQLAHHPDHRSRVVESQLAAFSRGAAWEETVCLRRADGEFRWFLARALPYRGGDGRILRWIGTSTDISDRIEAERAIAASEARFRRALDIDTVGVMFSDTAGVVVDANDAFLRLSGYSRADVRSGRVRADELTPPECRSLSRRAIEELTSLGRATPYEQQCVRKDGSRWWALFAATRLDERESVQFVVDLTAQKTAELEREDVLARERAARADAERATHARDEILAILAHDLRTPIQSIMNITTLLDRTADAAVRQRQIGLVRRAALGMQRLVSDLLDGARIESGTFAIRAEALDVGALIQDVVEMFEPEAAARNVRLRAHVSRDLRLIAADHDRLLQLLSNLLGNALKFTDAGADVSIHAANADCGVQLTITDGGRGIPSEDLPWIFDRFWRGRRAAQTGTGLGLAICKAIVEAHGGRISAASAVGRGTTFHIELPDRPHSGEWTVSPRATA